MPDAAMADMPHHDMPMGEEPAADCDEQPGPQSHDDHQHKGDQEDPSKLSHGGCCVMACGGTALQPTYFQVKPVEQNPTRLQVVTDDRLRDRSVSPLRRPPRPVA